MAYSDPEKNCIRCCNHHYYFYFLICCNHHFLVFISSNKINVRRQTGNRSVINKKEILYFMCFSHLLLYTRTVTRISFFICSVIFFYRCFLFSFACYCVCKYQFMTSTFFLLSASGILLLHLQQVSQWENQRRSMLPAA